MRSDDSIQQRDAGQSAPIVNSTFFEEYVVPLAGGDDEDDRREPNNLSEGFLLRYDKKNNSYLVLDMAKENDWVGDSPDVRGERVRRLSMSDRARSVKNLKDLEELSNPSVEALLPKSDSVSSGISHSSRIVGRAREMSDYGFGQYWEDEAEGVGETEEGPNRQQSQLATLERMAIVCDDEAPETDTLANCEGCKREEIELKKEVLFQARNHNVMIGTKCFYKHIKSASREVFSGPVNILKQNRFDARQVWFACAIGGIRIIKDRKGQHAEFQVVAASGIKLWSCWKRYSDFKEFAEYIGNLNMPKTNLCWSRMNVLKRAFRCLEVPYLLHKSALLQDFLQSLLFESQSEELFMLFIHHV